MRELILRKRNLYFLTFVIALSSMLGSLYFSEVELLTPCVLCWYQRIAMYPIVFLSAVGIWYKDGMLPRYVLPLSIVGAVIAGYHYVIQMVKPAADNLLINCTKGGVSCSTIDISYFGFITIPLLSFIAFIAIAIMMLLCLRIDKY